MQQVGHERFERDGPAEEVALVGKTAVFFQKAALGFGFDFASDGDGAPIDPAARYRLDPEQGPLRVLSERTGERRESATGQGLLALAEDAKPPADDIASLRLPLRAVLLHHLGGRGLKSWEMLGELGRLAARGEMGPE